VAPVEEDRPEAEETRVGPAARAPPAQWADWEFAVWPVVPAALSGPWEQRVLVRSVVPARVVARVRLVAAAREVAAVREVVPVVPVAPEE
jgi:hypothetical protein